MHNVNQNLLRYVQTPQPMTNEIGYWRPAAGGCLLFLFSAGTLNNAANQQSFSERLFGNGNASVKHRRISERTFIKVSGLNYAYNVRTKSVQSNISSTSNQCESWLNWNSSPCDVRDGLVLFISACQQPVNY